MAPKFSFSSLLPHSWRVRAVAAGGVATQAYLQYVASSGAPASLEVLLGQALGGLITGTAASIWANDVSAGRDDGLNQHVVRCSGRVVANAVTRSAAQAQAEYAKDLLKKLGEEVGLRHEPGGDDAILAVPQGLETEAELERFVDEPRGFLGQQPLTKEQWVEYLRAIARSIGHDMAYSEYDAGLQRAAGDLQDHYARRLYEEVKQDEHAFRGVSLRLLNRTLASLHEFNGNQARRHAEVMEALGQLRSQCRAFDSRRLETAAASDAGLREDVAVLVGTVRDLPGKLDLILTAVAGVSGQVEGVSRQVAAVEGKLDALRRDGLPVARGHIRTAPKPDLCEYRGDVVARIVRAIHGTADGARGPIGVFGPLHVGKSTVIGAALHEATVVQRFGERRLQVRCDGLRDREAVLTRVAQDLGMQAAIRDLEGEVLARLGEHPAVLALDNFETPWDASRTEIESLLRRVLSLGNLVVLVGVRGSRRPALDAWRLEEVVRPLDPDEARRLFLLLADPEGGKAFARDPLLAQFVQGAGGLPGLVRLLALRAREETNLAHLVRLRDELGPETFERPDVPEEDRVAAESLGKAVQVSLGRRDMTAEARRLLGMLGLLPGGLARRDAEDLLGVPGFAKAAALRGSGLAEQDGSRTWLLAPVREYARVKLAPAAAERDQVVDRFLNLARVEGQRMGADGAQQAFERLLPEVANVEEALRLAVVGGRIAEAASAVRGWKEFARFTGLGSVAAIEECRKAAEARGLEEHVARMSTALGDIALARSNHEEARGRYEEALPLYRRVGDVLGEANCIRSLGDIALRRSNHEEARGRYEEALRLYARIPEPYSIGGTHRRLARLERDEGVVREHVRLAREAWTNINLPDLVAELDAEFGGRG